MGMSDVLSEALDDVFYYERECPDYKELADELAAVKTVMVCAQMRGDMRMDVPKRGAWRPKAILLKDVPSHAANSPLVQEFLQLLTEERPRSPIWRPDPISSTLLDAIDGILRYRGRLEDEVGALVTVMATFILRANSPFPDEDAKAGRVPEAILLKDMPSESAWHQKPVRGCLRRRIALAAGENAEWSKEELAELEEYAATHEPSDADME
jgi:hypothetical protein